MRNTRAVATVGIIPLDGAKIGIRFRFPPLNDHEVVLEVADRVVLDSIKKQASALLNGVARLGDSHSANLPTHSASRMVSELYEVGRGLLHTLAGPHRRRLDELASAFKIVAPFPLIGPFAQSIAPVPVVEMHSARPMIPLEVLPVFDRTNHPSPRTAAELMHVASRLLGFKTVIHRVLPTNLPSDHTIRMSPRLPVHLIRHASVGLSEVERLTSEFHGQIAFDGPWPTTHQPEIISRLLVDGLYHGTRLGEAGGMDRNFEAQVHHFFCHCDTTSDDDNAHALKISGTQSRRTYQFTKKQLDLGYTNRYYGTSDRDERTRGMVFLNACDSSRIDPFIAGSFPEFFLSWNHRAFIGTEAILPLPVASTFARYFYKSLLDQECLASALFRARTRLLNEHQNPLGILYSAYGDLSLTVSASSDPDEPPGP